MANNKAAAAVNMGLIANRASSRLAAETGLADGMYDCESGHVKETTCFVGNYFQQHIRNGHTHARCCVERADSNCTLRLILGF